MAAALLALLMLSYASVQSIVMQAAMPSAAGPMQICGGAAPAAPMSMSMTPDLMIHQAAAPTAHSHGHRPAAPSDHKTVCPYCAAAAHAPMIAHAAPIQPSAGFVYAAFRVVSGSGPRGPPARRACARGPPTLPPIA